MTARLPSSSKCSRRCRRTCSNAWVVSRLPRPSRFSPSTGARAASRFAFSNSASALARSSQLIDGLLLVFWCEAPAPELGAYPVPRLHFSDRGARDRFVVAWQRARCCSVLPLSHRAIRIFLPLLLLLLRSALVLNLLLPLLSFFGVFSLPFFSQARSISFCCFCCCCAARSASFCCC